MTYLITPSANFHPSCQRNGHIFENIVRMYTFQFRNFIGILGTCVCVCRYICVDRICTISVSIIC